VADDKRAGRFQRLGGETGDLFEHFGVRTEPQAPPPAAVERAIACPICGWLRPRPAIEPCWSCGAPGEDGEAR
jgi:hypothetical protein